MGKWIKKILPVLCLLLIFSISAKAEQLSDTNQKTENTIIINNTKENVISVDTNKKYKGMNASFAKGYEPVIQKNTMELVIPFLSNKELENNKISVGVVFEREENSPFYYKNYQKEVKQSENNVYLYQCQIKLKKDRVNGQYPLHLSVKAQTVEKAVQQDFTIYVEITDGKAVVKGGEEPEENNPSDEPVGEEGVSETDSPEDLVPVSVPASQGEEVTHQPRVMIFQNSLQGISVQAGNSTTWTIKVKNCSSRQSLENMKIALTCESKDISFEKNTWYFEKIGVGNTVDLSQNITIAKKAAEEPISVSYTFEYEDAKGNAYASTDTVNISVSQPQQASLVNMSFPESINASETSSLTFQIQNTGLAVIYNAKVRLEAKGLFPVHELFIGNMEANSSVDGEIPVFAGTLNMDTKGELIGEEEGKYGETSGIVVFSYEDVNGKVTEQELELHTTIKKPRNAKDEEEEEKEEKKTNQWWAAIVVEIILVMFLINIFLLLRMKHYRKINR